MKKNIVAFTVAAALSMAARMNAQLYVPVPPSGPEPNHWNLILTNLAARQIGFTSTEYLPGQGPRTSGLFTLRPGQSVFQEEAGSIGGFAIIKPVKSGLVASSRLTDPDGIRASRLPIFTPSDVFQSRRRAVFQFFPLVQPGESVSVVVLSVTLTAASCSATISNDLGTLTTSQVTIAASTPVETVKLSPSDPAAVVEVTCNKPFLAFAYRDTSPEVEIVGPSTSPQ